MTYYTFLRWYRGGLVVCALFLGTTSGRRYFFRLLPLKEVREPCLKSVIFRSISLRISGFRPKLESGCPRSDGSSIIGTISILRISFLLICPTYEFSEHCVYNTSCILPVSFGGLFVSARSPAGFFASCPGICAVLGCVPLLTTFFILHIAPPLSALTLGYIPYITIPYF